MISEDQIRAAVAILVREAQPERVILFGSYARGEAKPVDLLVTDLSRLSSSWADFPGSYLYDALRQGKVLYAVEGAGASAAA